MNKGYLLFAGQYFYPEGGFDDFVGAFDSRPDAEAKGDLLVHETRDQDWYHVVDVKTWSKVAAGSKRWE